MNKKKIIQLFIPFGMLWILIGFTVNEWTVAYCLEMEEIGPLSRIAIWALDIVLVSWGILTIFYCSKQFVQNLNLCMITLAAFGGFSEVTLQLYPRLFGQEFANGILTKYTTGIGGIFYKEADVGMWLMVPAHKTEMYYNGYIWTHETDNYGFRNTSTRNKGDVILLGDSYIYGHGVNIEHTVGYLVEQQTNYVTVNLGTQGHTSWQEACLLSEFISQFEPKYVLYFFYENDIHDLSDYRTDEQLQEFLEKPYSQVRFPSKMAKDSALKIREEHNYRLMHTGSLLTQLQRRLYSLKIPKWIAFRQKTKNYYVRMPESNRNLDDPQSIGWQYTKKMITYMNVLAQDHSATFIIVPITPDNRSYHDILKQFAKEQNIPFLDTYENFRWENTHLYLLGDGHFSKLGATKMAHLVGRYLESIQGQRHRSELPRESWTSG